MSLYQQQIELEDSVTNEGVLRAVQLVAQAYEEGRAVDTTVGKYLFMKAYQKLLPSIKLMVEPSKSPKFRGKYYALLRRCKPEIIAVIALRQCINACAKPNAPLMQDVLRAIGIAIETEVLVLTLTKISPDYVDAIDTDIKVTNSFRLERNRRKFTSAARAMGMEYVAWSAEERLGVASKVLDVVLDLGLFQKGVMYNTKGSPYNTFEPAPILKKHLTDAAEAAKALIKYPPMLVPPRDWVDYYTGGYLTDELTVHAPLMTIRTPRVNDRKWVLEGLSEGQATLAKEAANRAQKVPYRINKKVLEIASRAVHNPEGILGFPPHAVPPKPEFPFEDSWLKHNATSEELDKFRLWKSLMCSWYKEGKSRRNRKLAYALRLKFAREYQDAERLYFPVYFDWRGRLYFRSTLTPQSHDSIRGVLEFADAKRLGREGLYWLKVHIANACGYDKAHFDLRAKWCDENWGSIQQFLADPLNIEPPDRDTSFVLLQAGYALQEALELPNPEDYLCHVPCAMDATCSGLQHFSAMFRDEEGAKHTNLTYTGADYKEDIYKAVAAKAEEKAQEYAQDTFVARYWRANKISRVMAKKPVMTYVYGSTLISAMEYVTEVMKEEEYPKEDGYGHSHLCVPVAKALRASIARSVPKAGEAMKYLQALVYSSDAPLRWVTPAGTPVLNWTSKEILKEVRVRCLNVDSMTIRSDTGEYDKIRAANGICPNWTHSLDSAHLCLALVAFNGLVVPIHDSFATHMSDVSELHKVLRKTFYELYSEDVIQHLYKYNTYSTEVIRPTNGSYDIEEVLTATYMFC